MVVRFAGRGDATVAAGVADSDSQPRGIPVWGGTGMLQFSVQPSLVKINQQRQMVNLTAKFLSDTHSATDSEDTYAQQRIPVLQRLWNHRHPILHEVTSPAYQHTQSRIIHGMAALEKTHDDDDVQRFRYLARQHGWGARTRKTYWGALISARTQVGLPSSPPHQAMSRLVNRQARVAPHWACTGQTSSSQISRLTDLTNAVNWNSADIKWHLAAILIFLVGGRVADVATIRLSNITPDTRNSAAILFVRGKTVQRRGPFTVHVTGLALTLTRCLSAMAKAIGSLYLLIPSAQIVDDESVVEDENSALHKILLRRMLDETCTAIRTTMRVALQVPDWTVRALRRGGLSTMSLAGVPEATLLTFSRHADRETLQTYLGNGILNGQQRVNQHKALQALQATSGLH